MMMHALICRLIDVGARRRRTFGTSEDGGILIFTLFLILMIMMIGGIAVDTMRFEARRVLVQNTTDSAVLAASSLSQDLEATELVRDYFNKAGLNPDIVNVRPTERRVNDGALIGRTIAADAPVDIDTAFMGMLGIERLAGTTAATASEGIQNIEISLILDISGSMGKNSRLTNLKKAAKQFVNDMLGDERNAGTTTISIVPYNATVVAGSDILKHMNAAGEMIDISDLAKPYTGMLDSYRTVQTSSTCVRFYDDQFESTAISEATPLDRVSHFALGRNSFERPQMSDRWCDETRSSIIVHSDNIDALEAHIEGLNAGGYTGIDNGMKWGTALLDPAFAPVVKAMVADGTVPDMALGRPGQFDRTETQKIVVLMTDGDNTYQRDLRDDYKSGPSRVWYAPAAGDDETTHNGEYFVLMPEKSASKRFYVPGDPTTSGDNDFIPADELPADAVQLDYIELHDRFAVKDIAEYFFKDVDSDAYSEHLDGQYKTEEEGSIDSRLADICDAAKKDGNITVYTIGYEAPDAGQKAMKNCATNSDSTSAYYYPTNGTGISAVFASIAANIQKLRLTN